MSLNDLTKEAVLQAVAECQQVGRDEFLAKHGFGSAESYYVVVDGKRYDSKAIAGVAHGYARPDLGPLAPSEFSGGSDQVQKPLKGLGFEVLAGDPAQRKRPRNPTWSRDELILALDYYLAHPNESHDDGSQGVVALSEQINALAQLLGHDASETLRNANGVSMKLLNFRAHDPAYKSRGQVGLQRGNRLEKELWDRYADDRPALKEIADVIRERVEAPDAELREAVGGPGEPEIAEAVEGRIVTRLHRTRERDRTMVKRKKDAFEKRYGRLYCEVCSFDFVAVYGERGKGFIECHHTKPVSALNPGETTKIADLVLLCANCHRMVHAKTPWLSISELRGLVVE